MTKRLNTLTVLLLTLISVAHISSAEPESTKHKSLRELAAEQRTRSLTEFSGVELQLFVYEREILREFFSGDLDEALDVYLAEDAIVCPPGIEMISGRETQKEMFKTLLKMDGFSIEWEPVDVYVGPSGDMGYAYGLVRWKEPNKPQHLGKYISIWVKEDGKWQNKVEIRNYTTVED